MQSKCFIGLIKPIALLCFGLALGFAINWICLNLCQSILCNLVSIYSFNLIYNVVEVIMQPKCSIRLAWLTYCCLREGFILEKKIMSLDSVKTRFELELELAVCGQST